MLIFFEPDRNICKMFLFPVFCIGKKLPDCTEYSGSRTASSYFGSQKNVSIMVRVRDISVVYGVQSVISLFFAPLCTFVNRAVKAGRSSFAIGTFFNFPVRSSNPSDIVFRHSILWAIRLSCNAFCSCRFPGHKLFDTIKTKF